MTYLVPGVLHGTAAMNGSARRTALAVLLLGVPVLAASMALAWAGRRGRCCAGWAPPRSRRTTR